MSWGGTSAKKWGRKPTRERGSVVWTDNSGAKPAPFMQVLPRYEETIGLLSEWEPLMYAGSMWTARIQMGPDAKTGAFPILVPTWGPPEQAIIKVNSLLIYTGTVRIDERESNGRIVSVPRHTFIAGNGRYIVTNFSFVCPIV